MRFIDYYPETYHCFVNETENPVPSSGEVLCKVTSFGINRADLLQKQGKYPPPKNASSILGMEVSGIVEKVADAEHADLVGEPVCAMITGGGYAEYVTIPVSHLIPVLGKLDLQASAAIPEVFLTAYQAMFSIANLQTCEKVLIHAGASGVGTAAIQLAKAAGASVASTASSEAKNSACLKLGADIAINYRKQDFAEVLNAEGFFPDVIVDIVGEGHVQKNLKIAAMDCRIVQLAMLGGRFLTSVDMAKLLAKRIRFQASTLRNRSDVYKTELVQGFLRDFGDALHTGEIHPVVDSTYAVDEINQAHETMSLNKNIGKLLVSW